MASGGSFEEVAGFRRISFIQSVMRGRTENSRKIINEAAHLAERRRRVGEFRAGFGQRGQIIKSSALTDLAEKTLAGFGEAKSLARPADRQVHQCAKPFAPQIQPAFK